MKATLYSLALAALLTGCASSHVITGKTRPAIDPAQVRVYSAPPAKYEEIAIVEASSRGAFAFSHQGRTDAMLDRLKEEAAKLGANGLLLQGYGNEAGASVGTGVATTSGGTSRGFGVSAPAMHKAGQGRAIYVTQE